MLYTCTSDMKDCFLGSLGSLGFSFSDPAQNTSLFYRLPSHWRVASSFVGFSPSHKIFGHLGQHRFERNRSVGYFRFPSVGRSLNTNFSPGLGLATISLLALRRPIITFLLLGSPLLAVCAVPCYCSPSAGAAAAGVTVDRSCRPDQFGQPLPGVLRLGSPVSPKTYRNLGIVFLSLSIS